MNVHLVAVCVGRPERRGDEGAADAFDRPWESAIWKNPIAGPVGCDVLGLDGDAQVDRRVHGGPEKAVLAYAARHFTTTWRGVLPTDTLRPGAFGENLTIDGLDEADVAIGDVVAIGTARLQVAQPRGPCWKLVRKFRREDLVERVLANGCTGWYLRVLQPGAVQAGDRVAVVERPFPALSIAAVNRLLYERPVDAAMARALVDCPLATPSLRQRVARLLD